MPPSAAVNLCTAGLLALASTYGPAFPCGPCLSALAYAKWRFGAFVFDDSSGDCCGFAPYSLLAGSRRTVLSFNKMSIASAPPFVNLRQGKNAARRRLPHGPAAVPSFREAEWPKPLLQGRNALRHPTDDDNYYIYTISLLYLYYWYRFPVHLRTVFGAPPDGFRTASDGFRTARKARKAGRGG